MLRSFRQCCIDDTQGGGGGNGGSADGAAPPFFTFTHTFRDTTLGLSLQTPSRASNTSHVGAAVVLIRPESAVAHKSESLAGQAGSTSTRQILLGDEIVQVNGEDVREKQLDNILVMLRGANRPVEVTFHRSLGGRAPALNECFVPQGAGDDVDKNGGSTLRRGTIMHEAMEAYPKIVAGANATADAAAQISTNDQDDGADTASVSRSSLLRAFRQIDADILRTSARRLHGPAKRGGKLAGVTISSFGSAMSGSSKGLMESMVSAALGGDIPSLPMERGANAAAPEDEGGVRGRVQQQQQQQQQQGEKEEKEEDQAREQAREQEHTHKQEESEQDVQLRNVLRAHALHDSHVRYSQAMSFLAQALLTAANGETPRDGVSTEAVAFGLLTSLMNDFGCRALFAQGMSGLKCCFFQLSALMQDNLPLLKAHFDAERIDVSMFATSWFLTLFSNYDTLGPKHVAAVLTVCLADGWKYIFKVALAVLAALQDQLLGSDFEGMMRILQHPHSSVSGAFPRPRALLREADAFKVTHRKLRQLEGRFLTLSSV